ncbi:MAG TPA: peptidoglycan bridge formation glycyltransferase FemA/FemB family protein [Candidatus Limnocylindria bacterium]|nr:peptidoglycan bridge formation glycyltransferase FemA/FemB family protein [Candidatus Limnocylindria bacterium]
MITVRPATETDASAWQAFLGETASGDFLHDWEWAAVASFDGQPQRRFVAEQDGKLVAIAAAQVRPLPLGRAFWYVPHGPVLDYDHAQAFDRLRALIIGLREAARDAGAIAVKFEPRLPAAGPAGGAFERLRLRREPGTLQVGQTRLVPLGEDAAMLAAFDKDTRYAVRRAEREGVEVTILDDAGDLAAIDRLHALVVETQQRAGFPMPSGERYRLVWRRLGGAGRARILEARHDGRLLASGMLVLEGWRSFYLYAGSLREGPGEPKRYATYALQWAMMRSARDAGARLHDLWGVAPPGAGPEHRWYGVGLFKKGFGGEEVAWAGTWDLIISPDLYRLRRALAIGRTLPRRLLGR